ncbi:MAG: hypothetical protein J7M26_04460 [Armatimonadetes bacterium]|nr:hypothetical protein [Armatimonadota bacterium]
MPIKLRGQDGYYSREVQIGGTKFRIRELDDETLDRVADIERQIRETLEGFGWTPQRALAVMRMGNAALESPELAEALGELAQAPPDVARTLRTLQKQRRDLIVTHGLVGWDLLDTPFAPDEAVRLPEWVKATLADEIMRDSLMPESTQDFLPSSPGPSPQGNRPG